MMKMSGLCLSLARCHMTNCPNMSLLHQGRNNLLGHTQRTLLFIFIITSFRVTISPRDLGCNNTVFRLYRHGLYFLLSVKLYSFIFLKMQFCFVFIRFSLREEGSFIYFNAFPKYFQTKHNLYCVILAQLNLYICWEGL